MKELIVDANVENIPVVTEFVEAELEMLNCSMKAQMQLAIVVDELFGNIARYAYFPETGRAVIRLEADEESQTVLLTFVDQGRAYNPLDNEEPDITLSADDREIGGLGILVVKKSVDDIWYEYQDGQNILHVKKSIK